MARAHFRPAGLRQKGRSRIWFDDHGWWLTMVELQPSSRYRRKPFLAFADAAQFEPAVGELCCRRAGGHVDHLADELAGHTRSALALPPRGLLE